MEEQGSNKILTEEERKELQVIVEKMMKIIEELEAKYPIKTP